MTRRRIPARTARARTLRRSMTEAEAFLWSRLRRGQMACRFRRQAAVGPYYPDFVCQRHRLIVELDGEQHFENPGDARRDAWLAARGYTIMRFWNNEVLGNLDVVLDTIWSHCRGVEDA